MSYSFTHNVNPDSHSLYQNHLFPFRNTGFLNCPFEKKIKKKEKEKSAFWKLDMFPFTSERR
jgi:hypothetical protein